MVRERELAAVVDALDTPGSTAVVLGAVGLGRSWLLDHAAATVHATGRRVLRAVGSADEHGMPYAALHQLLHGDLEQVDTALPARQRAALLGALGYDGEPVDDPLLVASATLTTLRLLAAPGPVAVVVDDVHLLDPASAQVLAFLARRVASEPVSVLVTTPGPRPPVGFERATAVVDLAPLAPDDAEAFLDAATPVPTGRTRLAVLASADGNPLVLRELAREHAGDPFAERAVLSGPLRPTRVLIDAFPVDLQGLSAAARRGVVELAVAADGDLGALDGPPVDPAASTELAARGIVDDRDGRVRFRHPVLRSMVFHAATPSERLTAHLSWIERLSSRADRQVWHRAAAAAGQPAADDTLGADLAVTADRLAAAGHHDRAVAAWELAADHSGDPATAQERLVAGLRVATLAAHVPTARRLVERAVDHAPGTPVTADLIRAGAWLDAAAGRHDAALDALLRLAHDHGSVDPSARVAALGPAAAVAYHLGRPTARRRVTGLVDDDAARPGADVPLAVAVVNVWAGVATGRYRGATGRDRVLAVLDRAAGQTHPAMGASAWILDETATALRQLTASVDRAEEPDGQASLVLGWALLEAGRWEEATRRLRRAVMVARTWGQATAEAGSLVGLAYLAAVRGDRAATERATVAAGRRLDPAASVAVDVRGHHARGLAALSVGDHAAAWAHLAHAAGTGERTRHFHASPFAVADLAEAAVRSGHREDVLRVLRREGAADDPDVSPRVTQLRHHGWAVAHADAGRRDDAERHFLAALADRRGDTWPFEQARLRLAHGRWLRRERRIAEAREPLELAAAEFERLGAGPWTDAARSELRAAGAVRGRADPRAAGLLTATERHIVRLAAAGLTNREIGDRLFLSPRTVGSHLYRVFPKLGVTTRTQLRDLALPAD